MTPEEKKAKSREMAKLRKQEQRDRDRQHREECGFREARMEMGSGTWRYIELIQAHGGYEKYAEAITTIIHRVGELIERDPSQYEHLISLKSLAVSAKDTCPETMQMDL